MTFPFTIGSLEEKGIMHCSKWLRHAVLFELDELQDFLTELGPHVFVPTSLVTEDSWQILDVDFKKEYELYLSELLDENAALDISRRRFFSLMLSSSTDDFYAMPTSNNRFAIKACRPVIQIQLYHAFISPLDKKIHPMVLHPEGFSFGLQFSYPQIYEDPLTHEFSKVLLDDAFPCTILFKKMVQWFRKNTKPVSFSLYGNKIHAPFREGKASSGWALKHKGLRKALSYAT